MDSFCRKYSTDLSDSKWQILEPRLPPGFSGGRHRKYLMREIINGIQYVFGAWRLLPRDFPHWRSVYEYF